MDTFRPALGKKFCADMGSAEGQAGRETNAERRQGWRCRNMFFFLYESLKAGPCSVEVFPVHRIAAKRILRNDGESVAFGFCQSGGGAVEV
jgi:hypothetical protein